MRDSNEKSRLPQEGRTNALQVISIQFFFRDQQTAPQVHQLRLTRLAVTQRAPTHVLYATWRVACLRFETCSPVSESAPAHIGPVSSTRELLLVVAVAGSAAALPHGAAVPGKWSPAIRRSTRTLSKLRAALASTKSLVSTSAGTWEAESSKWCSPRLR